MQLHIVPLQNGTLSLSTCSSLFAPHAQLIDYARIDGTLNVIGPVSLVAVTRDRRIPMLLSTTRDIPRVPVSIRTLSYSFLYFSKRGICNPANVNVLCNGCSCLSRLPPCVNNNRVVDHIAFSAAACRTPPLHFRTNAPSCVTSRNLTATLSCISDVNHSTVRTRRRTLAACTVDHLQRLPGIHLFNVSSSCGPTARSTVVSFLLAGPRSAARCVRTLSVNALLSRLNVTIEANRRYTRPLVSRLNILNAMQLSFTVCGAFSRISHLISTLAEVRRVF